MPRDRTTKAERRAAKAALAAARRRAACGGEGAPRWAQIARRGIGEHARLSRRRPTTWWFRGDIIPETTGAGRDGCFRARLIPNPNGTYFFKVIEDPATGAELPELPLPRLAPTWSVEAKLRNVDASVLSMLFPGPPVLPADPLKRLGAFYH
jgi:hypothetical protein